MQCYCRKPSESTSWGCSWGLLWLSYMWLDSQLPKPILLFLASSVQLNRPLSDQIALRTTRKHENPDWELIAAHCRLDFIIKIIRVHIPEIKNHKNKLVFECPPSHGTNNAFMRFILVRYCFYWFRAAIIFLCPLQYPFFTWISSLTKGEGCLVSGIMSITRAFRCIIRFAYLNIPNEWPLTLT